jgi:hypothetical protein
MQALRVHCAYGLIISCLVPLLFYRQPFLSREQAAAPDRNLHELTIHLLDKGVHLRAVPQRGDGLWLEALYLTRTEKRAEDLKALAIQPSTIDRWDGTVIIFEDGPEWCRDTSDWGENGWRWRDFLFYGDERILKQIQKALEG